MRLDWYADPSYLWIGLDLDWPGARATLCLLPMLPLVLSWRPEVDRYSGPLVITQARRRRAPRPA